MEDEENHSLGVLVIIRIPSAFRAIKSSAVPQYVFMLFCFNLQEGKADKFYIYVLSTVWKCWNPGGNFRKRVGMKKRMTVEMEASSPWLILFLSRIKDHGMGLTLNRNKI